MLRELLDLLEGSPPSFGFVLGISCGLEGLGCWRNFGLGFVKGFSDLGDFVRER
jgi:hypothetical protein